MPNTMPNTNTPNGARAMSEITTIENAMKAQHARGPFAYWSEAAEAAWRAEAPPEPEAPVIRGKYGFPNYCTVTPNSGIVRRRGLGAKEESYGTWEGALDAGRSYLVGDSVPMAQFIRQHRSQLTAWQKIVYAWCVANPYWQVRLKTPGRDWEIYKEPEFVMFALPHHDAGGERHSISRDGKTKVLINVD